MRQLLFTFMLLSLLLVSCGRNHPKGQGQEPQINTVETVNPRESIQWGEIHFIPSDEYDYTEEATFLYTTTDGTVDSVDFFLSYPTNPDEFSENGGGRIEEEDINFDGIPDLQICLGRWDGNWNMTYAGFVWDKEKGVFVNVPNYSEIFNPWIEETEQCIISNYREWMEGTQYRTYEKYEWVDGSLVMTDEWADDFTLEEEADEE